MIFTLKTQQIRSFFKLASGIPQNNIVSILAYVKLEDGKLTKTNVNTHFIYKIDAPDNISLLLPEKELKAFLLRCDNDEIKVSVNKRTVDKVEVIEGVLNDGKRNMKFQSADIKDFPTLPEGDKSDEHILDQNTLRAIGVASKNIDPNHIATLGKFVHLWNGMVVGADGNKMYSKKTASPLNLLISKDCASLISEFGQVTYYSRATFDYFEVGSILYAFVKTEAKQPDLSRFIPPTQPKEFLEFDTDELKSFCDTVRAASSSQVLLCHLKGRRLTFEDKDYNIDLDEPIISATGDYEPDLLFLPNTVGNFLTSLGFSTIKICEGHIPQSVNFYSDEDEDFRGTIMKLSINQ